MPHRRDAAFRVTRATSAGMSADRAARIHEARSGRIPPALIETTADGGPALGVASVNTRSGRLIRRPGNLADFAV